MENNKKLTEEPSKERVQENQNQFTNFPVAYRKFPYVIIRRFSAFYTKIPIHFKTVGDEIYYQGITFENVSDELLSEYDKDITSALHDIIITQCQRYKARLETIQNNPVRLCLVEGPETAYYFEGDEVNFSEVIPSGGLLITQDQKTLALNSNHYPESND